MRGSGRRCAGSPAGRSLTVDVDGEVYGCDLFAASYQKLESSSMRGGLEGLRMGAIGGRGFARRHASFPAAVRRARIFDRKDRKYSAYGRCRGVQLLHALPDLSGVHPARARKPRP